VWSLSSWYDFPKSSQTPNKTTVFPVTQSSVHCDVGAVAAPSGRVAESCSSVSPSSSTSSSVSPRFQPRRDDRGRFATPSLALASSACCYSAPTTPRDNAAASFFDSGGGGEQLQRKLTPGAKRHSPTNAIDAKRVSPLARSMPCSPLNRDVIRYRFIILFLYVYNTGFFNASDETPPIWPNVKRISCWIIHRRGSTFLLQKLYFWNKNRRRRPMMMCHAWQFPLDLSTDFTITTTRTRNHRLSIRTIMLAWTDGSLMTLKNMNLSVAVCWNRWIFLIVKKVGIIVLVLCFIDCSLLEKNFEYYVHLLFYYLNVITVGQNILSLFLSEPAHKSNTL